MNSMPTGGRRLTATQWLIVSMAAIGFAFDIYELLMAQFIIRPAIIDLTGAKPGTPEFAALAGQQFYVPAFAGGIFGLFGGYLTDRLGRRRVLTWSILLYAFSAFAAGYSTSVEMLLVLRSAKFVGVCVEFVAAVAWLAELFTDPKQRETVLGYTQAFSSFGGLLAAVAYGLATSYGESLPGIALPEWAAFVGGEITDAHAPWRYTLISGLIPAIPLIVIRPFLPESPIWAQKRAAGTLRRPSIRELFAPGLRQTTIVTSIMFACSYGAAFGAIQQIPQIVPGVPEVRAETEGKPVPAQKKIEQETAARVGTAQEIGGLAGRLLLAILAVQIVSRRKLLRTFQIPGLIAIPLVFVFAPAYSVNALMVGAFFAALFTVAQFSFWGNYLPRVYPVHLRGTGEGFAANIGGRMIGTSFAWVTNTMAVQSFVPGGSPPIKMAYTAAGVALLVYLVGSIACFWLPEPGKEDLPD
ncbi:MAG: MFS transporter [Planctomycetia bacterium]|nr:MFS transporter [Planctomycetia bacterium]